VTDVVEVQQLRKSYGDVEAVRGIDFSVDEGEIFALLGPNGAGKTTTVEILEGYRERDAGAVRVLGFDPAAGGTAYRDRIGIVLQSAGIELQLTVSEALRQYGSYFTRSRDASWLSSSVSPRSTTRASARCRAASCAASTSHSHSSAVPRSSSSTNRPPASIRKRVADPGT
jgi:ABC-2 type transport system ATP-binding protein